MYPSPVYHDLNWKHLTPEHKTTELACQQCAKCTQVTAEQSRKLTLCTHGARCISTSVHYHKCAPLCGYAKRAAEKRRKAGPGTPATVKRVDKAPRHYKCASTARECPDMECHHHAGRAPVRKSDCSMQSFTDLLTKVEGKDADEATRLWEQFIDAPVPGQESSRLSADAPVFIPAVKITASKSASHAVPRRIPLPPRVRSTPAERTKPIHEEKLNPPKSSTTPECGTSPARADDSDDGGSLNTAPSSVPSLEEKKLASVTTITQTPAAPPCVASNSSPPPQGPNVVDDTAPSVSELEASPEHGLRLKKYVVFSTHHVQGLEHRRSLVKRFMLKLGLASSRGVVLHNEGNGCVTDNVLKLAQQQISVVKYFWQDWRGREPEVHEDSISLFAGAFTHADYATVFADLAEHVLRHTAFTKMQSALLNGASLRQTVRLRVQSLIADHPLHSRYSAQQEVLSNTITFINNQLLLRGLLDEARKPDQLAPKVVDFRKGVVSKMSLYAARPSKSSARKPLLNRFMLSTEPSR